MPSARSYTPLAREYTAFRISTDIIDGETFLCFLDPTKEFKDLFGDLPDLDAMEIQQTVIEPEVELNPADPMSDILLDLGFKGDV